VELLFQQPVHPFDLLFLSKLESVVRVLAPGLPVLSGRIATPFIGALVRVAAVTLQEQLQVLSTTETAN
jgi:hypothetical protein